ncbi:hypothetical protein DDE82_001636 [Stemphylium lycopersici]|uniref:Uncharacterized protein n=1 Tax=Stemphylium lycopersici TaxID=183478 RepID=A0A364NAB9_STELY|nr:hypothetical protein DDE82_001636 [Stemphylium lycopersici]RAR14269.1 hypothetical protein DDE83_002381 [Stemphylium lycopersici]
MSDAIIDPAEVAVYFFLEAYHACLSKDSFDDINAGFQDPIAITLTPSALLASWHFPRSESIELITLRNSDTSVDLHSRKLPKEDINDIKAMLSDMLAPVLTNLTERLNHAPEYKALPSPS